MSDTMTRFAFSLRAFVAASLLLSAFPASAQIRLPANSLIKGSGPAVYFYGADGRRYVFPNQQTYNSWYSSFSNIGLISDSDLGSIQIGGNVTIKPGSTLVKVTTDPKVYAVARGRVLRWVKSEAVAAVLYGAAWNKKVVDIPDAFFTNYLVGDPIDSADQLPLSELLGETLPGTELFGPGSMSVTVPSQPASTSTQPSQPTAVFPSSPSFTMTITANQAVLNQKVTVFAEITGNSKPIKKLEIWSESGDALLGSCDNSTTCSAVYTVMSAPLVERFYPIATDDNGQILMSADERPTLVVASTSNDLQMQVTPQEIANGSRASFTSSYTRSGAIVKSHKIYALVPGNPQPYLWLDCGATSYCAGSTVFYRTTDLYSQIVGEGVTLISPSIRLTATGGESPKPVLKATSPGKNLMDIAMTPPSGEMIGETFIVNGTKTSDPAFALCDGPCSITIQINKPGYVTAFTWVGGKQEPSNVVTLTPE